MRYLQSFNRRLRRLRERHQLSRDEVAAICGVDESVVERWETEAGQGRAYPAVEQLLDLCFGTGTALEELLDCDNPVAPGAQDPRQGQLELPGLLDKSGEGLLPLIEELQQAMEGLERLSEQERELLRRFRATSAENRRLILQLL